MSYIYQWRIYSILYSAPCRTVPEYYEYGSVPVRLHQATSTVLRLDDSGTVAFEGTFTTNAEGAGLDTSTASYKNPGLCVSMSDVRRAYTL